MHHSMPTLLLILAATILNGLVALSGAFSLFFSKKSLDHALPAIVAFSAGALLAGALLHLLPEALESLDSNAVFLYTVVGFVLFFFVEKILHWHHCKNIDPCGFQPKKTLGTMILFGDGIHNFIDGLVIAASFLVSVAFGVFTTLIIISHEIPQEIGNFGVLVYSGYSRTKALFYNFISQLTCVIGGAIGYFFVSASEFGNYLLPFAAGGFIYIAASDLIPEMHKEIDIKKSIANIAFFVMGIALVYGTKLLIQH